MNHKGLKVLAVMLFTMPVALSAQSTASRNVTVSSQVVKAQGSRFAVVPFVGYLHSEPIYEHTIHSTHGPSQTEAQQLQRITVAGALAGGLRTEYSFARAWSIFVVGTYGGTEYEFTDSSEVRLPNGAGGSESIRIRPDGSIIAVGAGVERRFDLPSGLPDELRLSLGGSMPHFRLEEPEYDCVPSPWEPCRGVENPFAGQFDEWYRVPSLTSSLAVRHRFGRLGVEGRGTIASGRTKAGQLGEERLIAPRLYPIRTLVHSAHITVGMVWYP